MNITFLIGVPGSGKSTYAPEGIIRICPDEVRKDLYGDISIQGNPREVFGEVYKKIRHAIRRGTDFVYDATNADLKSRKSTADYIRKCADRYEEKAVINAIYLDTPLETCIKRNHGRNDRTTPVPDDVIRRMAEKLAKNPPSLKDGFDTITIK